MQNHQVIFSGYSQTQKLPLQLVYDIPINPFLANVPILYRLKTLARNGLIKHVLYVILI